MIAEQVSHYRIISKLGAGGMGEVYLAEDTQIGRRVAMEFLPPDAISDDHARKRLVIDHGEAKGTMRALQGYLVIAVDSSVNFKKEEAWH